jgi:predicted nucleic acid-binding protein
MTLVVDCSVTMAWCFPSETTAFTEAALDALAIQSAVVPALWALEVANVLATSLRRKVLSAAKVERFRALLARLPIHLEAMDRDLALGPVLHLARKHQLTSYDAAYLEVARRGLLPLATLDKALRAAAKAEGVELFAG